MVEASFGGEVVAIGLFTRSIETRNGFIKSCQYRLHQVGDPLLDQIWIEYNDFICSDGHRIAAVNASLQALRKCSKDWDEIILSMVSSSRAEQIQSELNGCRIVLRNQSYAVNLAGIEAGHDYLSTISANTRYQIRRSIRLYEASHGPVDFVTAKTTRQALEFFHLAGSLHRQRWFDSGYKNPSFIQFHEHLIQQSFEKKTVELIKVTSGGTIIAILYFHIVNKNVYFYLHGLRYGDDNKLKPGLVAHALATQYFLEQGMKKYDYMGGDAQYKSQLASQSEDLVLLRIQRTQLQFIIENLGRKIKTVLLKKIRGQR